MSQKLLREFKNLSIFWYKKEMDKIETTCPSKETKYLMHFKYYDDFCEPEFPEVFNN